MVFLADYTCQVSGVVLCRRLIDLDHLGRSSKTHLLIHGRHHNTDLAGRLVFFFCSGGGEGGVRGTRKRGGVSFFLLKILGGGGEVLPGEEGAGRVSAGNSGGLGGGIYFFFFSGPKFPLSDHVEIGSAWFRSRIHGCLGQCCACHC